MPVLDARKRARVLNNTTEELHSYATLGDFVNLGSTNPNLCGNLLDAPETDSESPPFIQ